VIGEEDYLSSDGVTRLAKNCNATDKPINVRGVEYTIYDAFYIRYQKQICAGVAFGIGLLVKQTSSAQARALLSQWREIHIGILWAYHTIEPPMSIQPEVDDIDQKFYQDLPAAPSTN
jgi:hypothetical protein